MVKPCPYCAQLTREAAPYDIRVQPNVLLEMHERIRAAPLLDNGMDGDIVGHFVHLVLLEQVRLMLFYPTTCSSIRPSVVA